MTRKMYDSVTAKDIPSNVQMVAGYISGTYKWNAADWARFPNAVHVHIATQAYINDGEVLDVERGDATPEESVDWVIHRRAVGIDPSIYCNQLNGWPYVIQAFKNRGISEPHYWVARYDNIAIIPVGAIAKQYANSTFSGGHFDLSVVADYWPGIDKDTIVTPDEIRAIAVAILDVDLRGGKSLADAARSINAGEIAQNVVITPEQIETIVSGIISGLPVEALTLQDVETAVRNVLRSV